MRGGDKKKATIIKAFIYKKYENQWGNLFVSKINFCTAIDIIVLVCTNSGFPGSMPITKTSYFLLYTLFWNAECNIQPG